MGPTASGKTDLAIALTEVLPCDIISVDSAMVYKTMDIGTAKPEAEVLAKAPHRLISFLDPTESYSAAQFRSDALREMADITARQRIPLLVGGTMMYFNILSQGLANLPAANETVRAMLLAEANTFGWPKLHQRLQAVDPKAAQRIKPTDSQRLQRALEVYEVTGRSLSEWHAEQQQLQLPYHIISLVIAPSERSTLHNRIALRFQHMLDNGFEEEVRQLHARADLNLGLPAMRAVGYRQMWSFLDGELTYDEMVEKALAATRQLAKRQLTWLRSWPEVNRLDSLSDDVFADTLAMLEQLI
ncbi:MAG: tRNA (adenosine(37)-N6)-dimethylallyltransferase MiaA [Endozoicomonas sp. (ex Botrylloides leachii)]|nr:tRNA (adenosine(37)-N6)-dimethylallyltransferase MiaA [Endozoicomonas sp. (ex Botrylloides leachii)]